MHPDGRFAAGPTSPSAPRVVVIIPARYSSTRLPGKPLADICGKPMVQHVYERASAARGVAAVLIATDDVRIADAARSFGAVAVMTRADHLTGTDRLAEVATTLDADIIVNVQGDEPMLPPAMIEEALRPFDDPDVTMTTLRRPFTSVEEALDPNVVKVVVDARGNALYFSRAPLPYGRNTDNHLVPGLQARHVGLYAYRRTFLLHIAALPHTPLERAEALEQLRVLEHGYRIRVAVTAHESCGVDAPADLERVRRLFLTGSSASDTRS